MVLSLSGIDTIKSYRTIVRFFYYSKNKLKKKDLFILINY